MYMINVVASGSSGLHFNVCHSDRLKLTLVVRKPWRRSSSRQHRRCFHSGVFRKVGVDEKKTACPPLRQQLISVPSKQKHWILLKYGATWSGGDRVCRHANNVFLLYMLAPVENQSGFSRHHINLFLQGCELPGKDSWGLACERDPLIRLFVLTGMTLSGVKIRASVMGNSTPSSSLTKIAIKRNSNTWENPRKYDNGAWTVTCASVS